MELVPKGWLDSALDDDVKVTTCVVRDGDSEEVQLHSFDDKPALENDYIRAWCKRGVLHRDNGPAVEGEDGVSLWFEDGVLRKVFDEGAEPLQPHAEAIKEKRERTAEQLGIDSGLADNEHIVSYDDSGKRESVVLRSPLQTRRPRRGYRYELELDASGDARVFRTHPGLKREPVLTFDAQTKLVSGVTPEELDFLKHLRGPIGDACRKWTQYRYTPMERYMVAQSMAKDAAAKFVDDKKVALAGLAGATTIGYVFGVEVDAVVKELVSRIPGL